MTMVQQLLSNAQQNDITVQENRQTSRAPAVLRSAADTTERLGRTPAMVASATTIATEQSAATAASSL
jgi:hypothetical protein